jgi:hypothetical protein
MLLKTDLAAAVKFTPIHSFLRQFLKGKKSGKHTRSHPTARYAEGEGCSLGEWV